ncbi:MAG: ABC transporter ATP-binding protein/permease [Clostridia bacterium]|nr:ABC transporter ATP-binding protein/permease [Clostridia bacterium]
MDNERIFQNEETITKAYDSKLMKRLLSYAKPYWALFLLSFLLLIASTLTDLARPYLLKVAIDDHIHGYAAPMIAYPKSSGQRGIPFEDRIFVRTSLVPPKTPANNIFSLVYLDKQVFLINGLVSSGEKSVILPTQKQSEYIYRTKDKNLSARKLTQDEIKAFRNTDVLNLKWIGLIFIGTILLGFVFNFLQIYLLSYVGQSIIFNLRQKIFTHIEKLPLSFFDKNPIGRLVTRVTNDAETLNEMYTNVLVTFVKDIFIILGSVMIMVQLDLRLALISLSVMPLVIFATMIFRKKVRSIYRKVRTALARINTAFSENISGMRIIQIFSKEKENLKAFSEINESYYRSGLKEIIVFGVFRPLIEMISYLAIALLIWYGGKDVIGGTLQFGVLYAFINYIMQLFQPINDLAEKFNILQSSMASSERIFMILDTKEEEYDGAIAIDKEQLKGEVEFKNVWFSYKEDEWILKDVSFKVPAGKTIAIVGSTGAGKTTIINLINRLYEINKGEILMDGVNIRDMKKDLLRKEIGVVLQDVFLFSGTIKDNIRLNEEWITDEQVQQVASFVNADHFIKDIKGSFDGEVKERGSTLSSGQRQLLAFARALAFNPSILILDEATANIDTETEILIQDALSKITQNRTTIIIAHRLSTIQHADTIIVLHKGRVKEMGTHQELLTKKGTYYNLYNLQYQGGSI